MRDRFIILTVALMATQAASEPCTGDRCVSLDDPLRTAKLNEISEVSAESAPKLSDFNHWVLSSKEDLLSIYKDTLIATTALQPVKCRWGTKSPKFVLGCQDGLMVTYFETHCRISTSDFDDYGNVTYRSGDMPVETTVFSESEDRRSLGLWTTQETAEFLGSIKDHDTLVAQIRPYADEPFVAQFDTSGIKLALQTLEASCPLPELQALNN